MIIQNYLGHEHFIVSQGKKSGIINSENNVLLEIKYNSVISVHDADLIQAYDLENDETILFNKSFEEIK